MLRNENVSAYSKVNISKECKNILISINRLRNGRLSSVLRYDPTKPKHYSFYPDAVRETLYVATSINRIHGLIASK